MVSHAEQLVLRAREMLPEYSDIFSEYINVLSCDVVGGVATCVTSDPHGLSAGMSLSIFRSNRKNPISSIEYITTHDDGKQEYKIILALEHDFTEKWQDVAIFKSPTNEDWNKGLDIFSVPSNTAIHVLSDTNLPNTSGLEYVLESLEVGIEGDHNITSASGSEFTFDVEIEDQTYTDMVIRSNVRIFGAVNIERGIELYTKRELNKAVGIICVEGYETSKDRNTMSDALHDRHSGQDYNIRIVEDFSFYVIFPTSDSLTGYLEYSKASDQLILPLNKVFGNFVAPIGEIASNSPVIYAGCDIFSYERAYIVVRHAFQCSYLLGPGNTGEIVRTRALREITGEIKAGLDEPLTFLEVLPRLEGSE